MTQWLTVLVPAAQYLHISTERQQYSLENQSTAILNLLSPRIPSRAHAFNAAKRGSAPALPKVECPIDKIGHMMMFGAGQDLGGQVRH